MRKRAEYADKVELLRASRIQLAGVPDAIVYNLAVPIQILVTAAVLARAHVTLLALPLFGIPILVTGRRAAMQLQQLQEDVAETTRVRTHLFTTALSNEAGKEVRVFGLGPTLLRRRDDLWRQVEDRILAVNLRTTGASIAAWAVFAVGYVGAVVLVAVTPRGAGRRRATWCSPSRWRRRSATSSASSRAWWPGSSSRSRRRRGTSGSPITPSTRHAW